MKKGYKFLAAGIISALTGAALPAQSFQVLYDTYLASFSDFSKQVSTVEAASGASEGYLMAGWAKYNASAVDYPTITRTDKDGQFSLADNYKRVYVLYDDLGVLRYGSAVRAVPLTNGDCFVVGNYKNAAGTGPEGIYWQKLNASGGVLVTKMYKPGVSCEVTRVIKSETFADNLFVCGWIKDPIAAVKRAFAMRLDLNGAVVWSRQYDFTRNATTDEDVAEGICESPFSLSGNKEILITGRCNRVDLTYGTVPEVFVLRIKSGDGIPAAPPRYIVSTSPRFFSATCIEWATTPAQGNGYVIGGYVQTYGGPTVDADYWVIYIDQTLGSVKWMRRIIHNNPIGQEYAYDLLRLNNGAGPQTFALCGTVTNGVQGGYDGQVVILDQNGLQVGAGQHTYGSTGPEAFTSITNAAGSSSALAMFGFIIKATEYKNWLVRTNALKATPCDYNNVGFQVQTPPYNLSSGVIIIANGVVERSASALSYDYMSPEVRCYSPVRLADEEVTITPEAAGLSFSVFPNPQERNATGIKLRLDAALETPAQITITDMLGRTVFSQHLQPTTSGEAIALLLTDPLEAGVYVVSLTTATDKMTQLLNVH